MTVRDLIRVLDSKTSVVVTPHPTDEDNAVWYRNASKIPQEELDKQVLEVTLKDFSGVAMFWICAN